MEPPGAELGSWRCLCCICSKRNSSALGLRNGLRTQGSCAEQSSVRAAAPPGAAGACPLPSRAKAAPRRVVFLRAARGEGADVALGRQGRQGSERDASRAPGRSRARRGCGRGEMPQGRPRCPARAAPSLQPPRGAAGRALSSGLAPGLSQNSHCHLPAVTNPAPSPGETLRF